MSKVGDLRSAARHFIVQKAGSDSIDNLLWIAKKNRGSQSGTVLLKQFTPSVNWQLKYFKTILPNSISAKLANDLRRI